MGNSEVVVEPNEAELTTEDTESTEEETQPSILVILSKKIVFGFCAHFSSFKISALRRGIYSCQRSLFLHRAQLGFLYFAGCDCD